MILLSTENEEDVLYKKPFSDDILADARGHIRGTVVRTKVLQNLPIIVISTFSILHKIIEFHNVEALYC